MNIIKELNLDVSDKVTSFLRNYEADQPGVDFIGTHLFNFNNVPPVIESILNVSWSVDKNEHPVEYSKFTVFAIIGTHYFKTKTSDHTREVYLVKTLGSKLVVIRSKAQGDNSWGRLFLGFSGNSKEFFALMSKLKITRTNTYKYYLGTALPEGFSLIEK